MRKIGPSKALYLLTTGAPIEAGYAYKLGLADFLVTVGSAEERAISILSSLTDGCREAVLAYKKIVYDYGWKDFDIALELERKLFAKLWDAPRHREEEKRFFADKEQG